MRSQHSNTLGLITLKLILFLISLQPLYLVLPLFDLVHLLAVLLIQRLATRQYSEQQPIFVHFVQDFSAFLLPVLRVGGWGLVRLLLLSLQVAYVVSAIRHTVILYLREDFVVVHLLLPLARLLLNS